MAKLIWWLTVFISCLVNSVAPFHMEEVPFKLEGYYRGTYTGALTGEDAPWSIYKSFFGYDDDAVPCDPKTFTPDTAKTSFKVKYSNYKITTGTWKSFPYVLALPENADPCVYTVGEGELVPIVAPENFTIDTSELGSGYSHTMTLTSIATGTKFLIQGMECWYCCIGHTPIAGNNYQHVGVKARDYANGFQARDIIGLANADTRISIIRNGKQISFSEYFAAKKDGTRVFDTPIDSFNYNA